MKVVKTDGIIPPDDANIATLRSAGACLMEKTCLTEDALIEHCADADGLLVLREPITANVIRALQRCRVISLFGIGVDMVDLDAAKRAGIIVTNVPDSNIEEVSCHAVAMALSLSRRLPLFNASLHRGEWNPIQIARGMQRPSTQIFGVVGLGRIGRLVAERAMAFGFRVIACDPTCPGMPGVEMVAMNVLIATADIISLHVPLTRDTMSLIDEAAVRAMKAGAVLINVSRGGLVDEAALSRALADGHLAGAGLDTFAEEPVRQDSPLLEAPNVLLSPHIAHFSEQSFAELRHKAFGEMARVLAGETPHYPVG